MTSYMKKHTTDPKVTKTLVRNCEQTLPRNLEKLSLRCTASARDKNSGVHENDLMEPTLCSSETLLNYITDIKQSSPPQLTTQDLNVNKTVRNSRITKKLNFHLTDRMYKNLVELNASTDETKTKERKPIGRTSVKRDVEPNIEDFYQDTEEIDCIPPIPVMKPKFKQIMPADRGYLHSLVSTFETL